MAERELTPLSTLLRWWRAQRESKNAFGTLRLLLTSIRDFLRDSLPDRRRQRYGDVDYDWEHRVNTTSATVGWRTRLLGAFNSPYQPIPEEQFREIMGAVPADLTQFTFIDIGSGKGRALLLANEYGFRRIVGIELLPELHFVAQENFRKLNMCPEAKIELVCEDAAEFSFPPEPMVVFLFNPLQEAALRRVMEHVGKSLQENPRPFFVAYANPVLEQIVASCPFLKKIEGELQYSIFSGCVE